MSEVLETAPMGSAGRAPFMPRLPSWYDLKRRLAERLVRWGLDLFPESGLERHAREELKRAGLLDSDADYGGALGEAVIDMQKVFAMAGHSGYSAGMATSIFEKVARYEPLTPLTGDDDEWVYHDGYGGKPFYQNKRCSHVFKDDEEAYDCQGRVFREPSGACYTSSASRVPVTFPYTPTTVFVDVGEGSGEDEA